MIQKKACHMQSCKKSTSGRGISKHKDAEVGKSFASLRNRKETSVVKVRSEV